MNKRLTSVGKHAFTLVEMVTAIAVLSFIFSFLAYLTYYASRNFVGVHEQVLSQINASNATEVTANLLRRAAYYSIFPTDSPETAEYKRILVAMPISGTEVTTGVLAYHSKKKELHWYDNMNAVTWDADGDPVGKPTFKFEHLENFAIQYQTMYRLTLVAGFTYRGFSRILDDPGNPQFGQFVTDVIAKNHFPDKGDMNYANDITTSGPATL
ncbi:MAG: type II secretion system protein [Candidatus Sumerlaeaceae bacterium]